MIVHGIEFICSEVEIIKAKNASLIGLKGKIIDETKNTFVIECRLGVKTVLKEQVTMRVCKDKKYFDIEGKSLVGRPEERLKKI